ncbi:MAG: hypothetical protein OXO48_17640 [Caldilineaceae bacterium]|nr:hypothetical protein [Caldilineaceae bacterium]
MPPPAVSSVTARACALGKGGCGSLSPPAGRLSRGDAAAENKHLYNRPDRRMKEA